MSTAAGKTHEAGAPIGLRQECRRCGAELIDHTNSMMVGEWSPSFFAEGALIEKQGGAMWMTRPENRDFPFCNEAL